MYPLVHSPTQTVFKSKWNTFKEWFTPDLTKRRPSQCSTTSTSTAFSTSTANTLATNNCCCTKEEVMFIPSHKKRPSITASMNEASNNVLDKCMSPFRRRPSTTSQCSTSTVAIVEENPLSSEIEKLFELYHFAMDEINYAEDSQGSPYYHGDRIAAKEAIDNCVQSYESLLSNHQFDNTTIGFKITSLTTKFNTLPPLQDDQLSL